MHSSETAASAAHTVTAVTAVGAAASDEAGQRSAGPLPTTPPLAVRWSSEAVREEWAPRIRAVRELWAELEWRSVAAGLRPSGLRFIRVADLGETSALVSRHGLSLMPVEATLATADYQDAKRPATRPAADGAPDHRSPDVRIACIIARPDHAAEAVNCEYKNAHVSLGRLLGYPPCCIAFFQYVWSARQMVDTTWPMACNTAGAAIDFNVCEVRGPWHANVLLRWLGVRGVPHLPCSVACEATARVGHAWWRLAATLPQHARAVEDWQEMLSWPVEWRARHEVATITTPVVTFEAATHRTDDELLVRYRHADV